MTVKKGTLSSRGAAYAAGPSIRDKFDHIFNDLWSPDNPNGYINLGVAENFALIPDVVEFVNNNFQIDNADCTYGQGPWGSLRLRKAMAKHMTKYFNAVEKVKADDIIFANGVTSLCEMLGFTIADAGDAMVFTRPIYQAFQIDLGAKAKVKCYHTDFGDVDQFSPQAISKWEETIQKAEQDGNTVRALMLCNPHNPMGQCYPKETIISLMRLCDKYKIHLLCDEIYANSVYEVPEPHAVPFTSVLSFDFTKYIHSDYVHVLYGFSKDFAAGGMRMGCINSKNEDLKKAMSSINQFAWSGNVNDKIATLMLEDEEWQAKFLKRGRTLLAEKNKLAKKLLDDAGIEYHKGANAGFFLWLDLRRHLPHVQGTDDRWKREEALADKMLEQKVFLTNGQSLSAPEPGYFRLIFSQEDRVIKLGVERLCKALGKASQGGKGQPIVVR